MQPFDFLGPQLLSEGHWRKPGRVQNFIGVCVSDSAEKGWVAQSPFEGMIAFSELGRKWPQIRAEHLEAAAIHRAQARFALQQMQRCSLPGARFGDEQLTL